MALSGIDTHTNSHVVSTRCSCRTERLEIEKEKDSNGDIYYINILAEPAGFWQKVNYLFIQKKAYLFDLVLYQKEMEDFVLKLNELVKL
jgi:hypothetical protein